MDAFRRCLAAARDDGAEAVTIGGDLWENENVTPDTRASVAHELGLLDVPVVIVTGNHDPHLRGGNYQRTTWSENVTIIDTTQPLQVHIGPTVSVWGVSWMERPLSADFLHGFRVPEDGRAHLLLMHGTARDERFAGASTHCPFDPADARRAGFEVVLSGHIHAASSANGVIYPGSPEPLDHSETGRHCYALVDIHGHRVDTRLIDVNRRRHLSVDVDCSESASSAEVESRVRDSLGVGQDHDAILRVRLHGETAPDCAIDRAVLVGRLERDFSAAAVEDETDPHVDYSEIARRRSADGLFVAGMLQRIEQSGDPHERTMLEMALRAGVRALSGQKDVLRVG